jgi:HEPN domain-containing protein
VVEKSLKGFLEWHDRPFDRTHELEKLGLCATVDPTLENLLASTGWLTAYAARFRYPGAPYEPTIDDAQEGLRLCRAAFEAILARLPAEVHP